MKKCSQVIWTNSKWQKIDDDKIKKEEFEEEKIKHSEYI